jgi:hypothetical protein
VATLQLKEKGKGKSEEHRAKRSDSDLTVKE